MALTGVVRRLSAEDRAREPRSLGVIAWFAGQCYGSTGRYADHLRFSRHLTPSEGRDWREGFAEGRRERVCHSWHGFTPCEGDHPQYLNPDDTKDPAE